MSRRYPRTEGLLLLSPTAQPDLIPCWGNGGFAFQTVGHAKREQLELSIYSSIYSRFGVEFLSRVLSWWRTHSHWVLDDSKASHEPTEEIMESDWRKVWDLPASSVSLGQAEGQPPVLGFLEIGTPNVYLNGYIHFRSMQKKIDATFLRMWKFIVYGSDTLRVWRGGRARAEPEYMRLMVSTPTQQGAKFWIWSKNHICFSTSFPPPCVELFLQFTPMSRESYA